MLQCRLFSLNTNAHAHIPYIHAHAHTHSHTATPISSEEEVGCPNQKNLVITGKSASLSKEGLEAFPGLQNPKQNKSSTYWESHRLDTYTQAYMHFFPPTAFSHTAKSAPVQTDLSLFSCDQCNVWKNHNYLTSSTSFSKFVWLCILEDKTIHFQIITPLLSIKLPKKPHNQRWGRSW